MCELCNENNGEMLSCQDCGALICFDTESDDDICAKAFVTASGDLFCRSCGRGYDRREEEEWEDDQDYCGEPDFTELADMTDEDILED